MKKLLFIIVCFITVSVNAQTEINESVHYYGILDYMVYDKGEENTNEDFIKVKNGTTWHILSQINNEKREVIFWMEINNKVCGRWSYLGDVHLYEQLTDNEGSKCRTLAIFKGKKIQSLTVQERKNGNYVVFLPQKETKEEKKETSEELIDMNRNFSTNGEAKNLLLTTGNSGIRLSDGSIWHLENSVFNGKNHVEFWIEESGRRKHYTHWNENIQIYGIKYKDGSMAYGVQDDKFSHLIITNDGAISLCARPK